MTNLNPEQFALADIDHGPEVPHALKHLGLDPDKAQFDPYEARVADYHPTHLDDIEDDEDYERTGDLLGHLDETPPIIVAHRDGEKHLLDGYARLNAAHTEGRTSLPAYRLHEDFVSRAQEFNRAGDSR